MDRRAINKNVKNCSICLETKSISEFYSRKAHNKEKGEHIYYYPECKECTKKRSYEWRKKNPKRYREIMRVVNRKPKRIQADRDNARRRKENGEHDKWLKNNPDKVREYNKNRNKKNHKISLNEWLQCKNYFNNCCAYCLKTWEQNKQETGKDLHREHVDDQGSPYLDNCVPSCRICNSLKWTYSLDEWYNENNQNYTEERKQKIINWIMEDHKKYIDNKK